ncbi:hypothetical protein [Deinococcus arcticus]|uniref:Uncharacterized protein n=1 Tax=Deinococcus arcticus TaxID=2136176 RepID=A0A2T3W8D6_9DEIO|nr:hypothetical protein [Deinococcus arcticus]PTA68171.1 hypothetical protein C8263_08855 [Deinococcus arcticus]
MLAPWSGVVLLIVCPLLCLWALRRRRGWLAGSAGAACFTGLAYPALLLGGPKALWWTRLYGLEPGSGFPEIGLLGNAPTVLPGLVGLSAGLALVSLWRERWTLAAVPLLGSVLAALQFWG